MPLYQRRGRKTNLKLALSLTAVGLTLLVGPASVFAHEGEPLAPHDIWRAWNWDPVLLLGLATAVWFYGRGVRSLWQRAGTGRGTPPWRVAAFTGALLALFIALVSPLDALSGVLFSAHMVQHLLLILVAAPLLVLGVPTLSLAWGVPRRWRRPLAQRWHRWWRRQTWLPAVWHTLTRPLAVWALSVGTLWLWHLPALYQAALQNQFIHILEHTTFLGTAVLFWWTVAACGRPGRMGQGAAVLYLFTTALQGGLLGSLLTFSTRLWYPAYAASTAVWGLTALEDQQLAGVIMWVPANIVYVIAALVLLGSWLQQMEQIDGKALPVGSADQNK